MQPQYLLCCLTSEVNHHQQDPFDLLGQKELSKENPDQCHFAASLPRKPHGQQKIKMEKHTFCNKEMIETDFQVLRKVIRMRNISLCQLGSTPSQEAEPKTTPGKQMSL